MVFWFLFMISLLRTSTRGGGQCEWGSQCSCSENGRFHSYSIDLLRKTLSSLVDEKEFLKVLEDDASSKLMGKEEVKKESLTPMVVPNTPPDRLKVKKRRVFKKIKAIFFKRFSKISTH
ncbi:unnamed protein product [Amaranthus hypochondriacus]